MARQMEKETTPQNQGQKEQNQTQQNQNVTVQQVENRWNRVFNANSGMGGAFSNQFLMNTGASFVNNPFLLNQRVKQLKTTPTFLDRNTIENALLNVQDNEMALRTATHSMIYNTYPLYRLQLLYEGILKYHSYIEPRYVKPSDFASEDFKSEWKLVDMWHKKLNPQKQFRRIVSEIMTEGKRAYYLRQSYVNKKGSEKVNYVHFQELPSDWYKIIKHSTESYQVVAFNFAYFWQAGTSLGQFPELFGKYYQELMDATEMDRSGRKSINVAKTPEEAIVEYNSDTMTWFYWRELPADECFMFSFTESDDIQISPFCSLLLQAQDLASYSLLQQQLLTVPLYSMLLGEMPVNDDNKSGSHIDDFQFSPEAVALFESKVNSSMPPGTTYNIVPSKNNTLHHFQEIPNANEIYNKGLQQLINTAGTSTLMTTTEKPSVAQVAVGKIIETRYIDRVYDQFALACNLTLEKMKEKGDLKQTWAFYIHGDSFSEEKELAAIEKSLTLGQIELFPKYLSYHNKSLLDAQSNIDWVESIGIYDKFKPLINTFGQSGVQESTGKKKSDMDNVENDNTAASIDSGTNTGDMKFSLKYCPVCGNKLESSTEIYPFCSHECFDIYMEAHEDD